MSLPESAEGAGEESARFAHWTRKYNSEGRDTTKLGRENGGSHHLLIILASVYFWPLLIIDLVARSVPARLIIC